ncbi:glycosyltransferase family 4 protein [Chryseobacterium sp. TY3]
MREFINMTMLNSKPTGVGVYCQQLYDHIKNNSKFEFLFINESKFLTLKRLLWNLIILPLKVKRHLIYSPSTHGSLFVKNQIITIHDLIAINFPQQYKFQYYYFKYYVPLLIRQSKYVVAISEFTKKEIVDYYKINSNKVKVIHNGFTKASVDQSSKDKEELKDILQDCKYFVCIGASFSHKNITTLIESIALFNDNNIKFVIVGKENDYFRSMKELALSFGLENIIFLNYISDGLLHALYDGALANIYISLYEGFGYPPLEAASHGTISIISDIPVMNEIYGDSMIFVDPKNKVEIAEKLTLLSMNSPSKEEVHSKTDYLFSKYSWENTTKSILDLINLNN